MGDIDDIIPEFDANYNLELGDEKTDTKNSASKDSTDSKSNIQISRTYLVLREIAHAVGRGDTYLIEHNGLESILKFYVSDIVLNEDAIKRVKEFSEELQNSIIRIHEYGYDENTERWYVIEEYATYG